MGCSSPSMLAIRPFAISSANGARTSVYLASSADVSDISGQYFYKCRVVKPSDAALDDAAAGPPVGRERAADRRQLTSATSGSVGTGAGSGARDPKRHATAITTKPRPASARPTTMEDALFP